MDDRDDWHFVRWLMLVKRAGGDDEKLIKLAVDVVRWGCVFDGMLQASDVGVLTLRAGASTI